MAARRTTAASGVNPVWKNQPAPALPSWQALLTPVLANAFHDLGVSVSVWLTGDYWHAIHSTSDLISFEAEFGVEARRWAYNTRSFERVLRERKNFHGEHAGLHDLFVPLQDPSAVRAILVSGPFAIARPTSADLLQRWYFLSGTQGRLADPVFSEYLQATLSILTLEGSLYDAFERLLSCFAALAGGRGDPDVLAAQAEAMRVKLGEARFADNMWRDARAMVSERKRQVWSSPDRARSLDVLGLSAVPEHVVVGLLLGRDDEPDPIDDRLRRDAFQRACVGLSRKLGGVVCTPVGEQGIAFLVDYAASEARTRARLTDVATRAAQIARRFGFKLHSGVSQATDPAALSARYRAALWAAEKALSQGATLVRGEPQPERSVTQLRVLRAELAASVGEHSNLLSTRFNRYVEAVLVHCGYRLERVRAHLEAGLERVAEPLLATGALDEKSFDDLCHSVEQSADAAQTATALIEPYRNLFAEMQNAMQGPTVARQDRGTRRALSFIRDHLSEPLSLAQVARAAGFAPDYFSRIFKRNEGVTFEQYTQKLRLERAKQMLSRTTLSIDGVRHLCGFSTRSYFHRVFKQAVGLTPIEYRERGQ